jgi:hypothetical protein
MEFTVDFMGKSGVAYRYWNLVNPFTAAAIQPVAGNYVFAKLLADGTYLPLYFGEAGDLQVRIPPHERWAEAARLGATHVMAHTTPAGEAARLAQEKDLIQYWNPPLNVQHRMTGLG